MHKKAPKQAEPAKRLPGRPPKDADEPHVETTVAMGCTYAERARLKLSAVSAHPPRSMSNYLRAKNDLEPIV